MGNDNFIEFHEMMIKQSQKLNLQNLLSLLESGEFDVLLSEWDLGIFEESYGGNIGVFDSQTIGKEGVEKYSRLKIIHIIPIGDLDILKSILPKMINGIKLFFINNDILYNDDNIEGADIQKIITILKNYFTLLKTKLSDQTFVIKDLEGLPETERIMWLINLIKGTDKAKKQTNTKLLEILNKC
nr:hypothetical protein [Candidatus Gracilibacteria bacterium]